MVVAKVRKEVVVQNAQLMREIEIFAAELMRRLMATCSYSAWGHGRSMPSYNDCKLSAHVDGYHSVKSLSKKMREKKKGALTAVKMRPSLQVLGRRRGAS
jgi:hypothetical protein